MLADRERIAVGLNDVVIQRLFAASLALQSSLPLCENPDFTSRIEAVITGLDDTIRQVRTTIFALEPLPGAERGVRARVLEACGEAARSLGFEPKVRFQGPIDRRVSEPVAKELLTTLREALSNVARHANARRVEVELSAEGHLHLRVLDDGIGLDHHQPGKGLSNMAERADSLGGSFTLRHRPEGGTEFSWRVPLGQEEQARVTFSAK